MSSSVAVWPQQSNGEVNEQGGNHENGHSTLISHCVCAYSLSQLFFVLPPPPSLTPEREEILPFWVELIPTCKHTNDALYVIPYVGLFVGSTVTN